MAPGCCTGYALQFEFMTRVLYAAAPNWAGVRHRFRSLSQAWTFAKHFGYRLHFLWGVSEGVAYCRFEELLASIPGIYVENVSERELIALEHKCRVSRTLFFGGHSLAVYRPFQPLGNRLIAFDLWGDLAATTALHRLTPLKSRPTLPILARLSSRLRMTSNAFIRRHNLPFRIGVRVRVTENLLDERKPRRIRRELNETIRAIIRMPWYFRIFVATDSEYVQQMLASHFPDARFIPKAFSDSTGTGRYVHRHNSHDMRAFMSEVACLSACAKVINIGGFVNDEFVTDRLIYEPFDQSALRAQRVIGQ